MKPISYSVDLSTQDLMSLIVHEMYQAYFAYGPGIYEKVYEASLAGRLRKHGLKVECQRQYRITDDYVNDISAFYADMVVDDRVIIELKSVEVIPPIAWTQLRTYLRLSGIKHGLLVNFNSQKLKDNIFRVVDGYQ
ncbi:GxxExxY protein [Lewinella sp. 4G2]|uniref:GxxExxY protein n=1 Tax=Lewinella sp. 4G2 TaxID=1803372 RepID=UPI0007B461F3|nr:hypothetical protein A3850_006585 [Lewinella sp. 4G2]